MKHTDISDWRPARTPLPRPEARYGLWRLLLCLLPALPACDLINPAEEMPSYLYLQPFDLRTDAGPQGSAAANITEAWLSIDGQFLGAYSLPALVPVLASGEREITLQAGIRDNGISVTPEIYPFYDIFRTVRPLSVGRVDTLRPVVRYSARARFPLIDDFERAAPAFDEVRVGNSDNRMRLVETGAFEGNASGRIRLDAQSPAVELATSQRFRGLTANSPFVYLELNYRSDVPVVFGVIGYRDGDTGPGVGRFNPGFRPREQWNKIYFNLSDLLANSGFDEVQIALQAARPADFPRAEAFIWFDNIKLVHF